jgi:hypothetical protein
MSGRMPAEEVNGLAPLAEALLRPDSDPVMCVAIFETAKDVHNRVSGESYPVVQLTRVEPVLEEDREALAGILKRAFDARNNKAALDLPALDGEDD